MHALTARLDSGPRSRSPRALGALLLAALLAGCASLSGEGTAPERMLRAEVAVDRGEYAFAADAYRGLAAASHDPLVTERAAHLAFDYGQPAALERIARDWLAREPTSESARRFLAVALLELDRPEAAAHEFAVLVRTGYPTPAAGFLALQESLAELDAQGAAAHMLARLAEQFPDVAEAQFAKASLALEASNSTVALSAADEALKLRPGWREAEWLRARALVVSGDCARGLAESAALAAEASDGDRLMHAWLLNVCEKGSEAEAVFADLARGTQFRADALDALAGIALDAGRYDEANTRYSEALAAGHENERAVYGLALVADRRGDPARALRLYTQVTVGPRATTAQLRAYHLRLELGDAEGAARALDDYLAGAPDKLAITSSRAQLLAELDRGREALALLERAIAVYPDQEELYLARATVLEKIGRAPAAIAELDRTLRRWPNEAIAENALGYTLADHGLALERAETLIRRALDDRPDSPAIQDSLGWVLYRRGRLPDALAWLQRAYGRDPDPEVAAHLGEVQWAGGDTHAALATWRGALARSPGNRGLVEALARRGESPEPARPEP
jgi:tetratricopeptide (TPR) repeat protein